MVANTAIALAQTGKRVLVLDADLGLGNVDILLGLTPKYTLEHVLAKTCRLEGDRLDRSQRDRGASCQHRHFATDCLDRSAAAYSAGRLERLASTMDVLLIDTGAGISSTVTYFLRLLPSPSWSSMSPSPRR